MKNKMSIFVDLYGCPYSLMDKIKDSGSFDCGSIPHGGTKVWTDFKSVQTFYILVISTPTTRKIVYISEYGRVNEGKSLVFSATNVRPSPLSITLLSSMPCETVSTT